MKAIFTIALLLFASFARGELTAKQWNATCRVRCPGGVGSGVLVRDSGQFYVLTAAHVVRGAESATIVFRDGRQFPVHEMYIDKNGSDSAIILLDDPGVEPAEVADATPEPGTTVLAVGYGAPGQGLIGQYNTIQREIGNRLYMHGSLRGGDSGGPVFDDQGRVIGLNSSIGLAVTPGYPPVPNGETFACCWRPFSDMITRMRERIRDRSLARAGRMQERLDGTETQCPGGSCPPRYSQPRPQQRPQGDVLPPGFSQAQPPPPPAPAPSQPAPIDYEKLASMVAAKIPKPADGRPGERGPAGPQGPQGAPGPSGKDGKDADLTRHGFFYQVFDTDGSVLQPLTWMPVVPENSAPDSTNTMSIKMFSRNP